MNEYERIREEIIIFFLTEVTDDYPISYVEDLTRIFLKRRFHDEWVDNFLENQRDVVISDLVYEYNKRTREGFPLNFTFADDESKKVIGWKNPSHLFSTSNFQKALLNISDTEFEKLTSRIIQIIGCSDSWCTPISHDQGLDAFGCISLFKIPTIVKDSANQNLITAWALVQAKHYNKEKLCSSDVREFIGSGTLAKYRIFSTLKEKYKELELKPFIPIVYIMITSGEVKRTVKILAERAGIKILSSNDICAILYSAWQARGVTIPESESQLISLLKKESKSYISK